MVTEFKLQEPQHIAFSPDAHVSEGRAKRYISMIIERVFIHQTDSEDMVELFLEGGSSVVLYLPKGEAQDWCKFHLEDND